MIEITKIDELAFEELREAIRVHPNFNSWHEAFAVILEEIEKTRYETEWMAKNLGDFWTTVKKDNASIRILSDIRVRAINTAREAIQVVAMCDKATILFKDDEG